MINEAADSPTEDHIPLAVAADLQDHLLTASNDLDRLQTLLADACDGLMRTFSTVSDQLRTAMEQGDTTSAPTQAYQDMLQTLGGAVTALQFQDMASQLIGHTMRRLRSCSDTLARETFDAEDGEEAGVDEGPLRASPVAQAEMDAGSVELF